MSFLGASAGLSPFQAVGLSLFLSCGLTGLHLFELGMGLSAVCLAREGPRDSAQFLGVPETVLSLLSVLRRLPGRQDVSVLSKVLHNSWQPGLRQDR